MQHDTSDSSSDEDTLQRCLSAPSALVLRDRLVRQDGGSVLLGQVAKIMRRAQELCRTNSDTAERILLCHNVVRGLNIAKKLACKHVSSGQAEQVRAHAGSCVTQCVICVMSA